MRACGEDHAGLCPAELTASGPDDRPLGICDDCARVVRPSGRGVSLQVPEDTPREGLVAMALQALQGLRLCTTCGQVRP